MGFRQPVSEDALIACGRSCSICHKFCGPKIELHHIKQAADGGEDSFDNCIPLCLDCHAEVNAYNPRHPKGKKYGQKELHRHRDNWYEKVKLGFSMPIETKPFECDIELYLKIKGIFDDPNLQRYLNDLDLGNDFNNDVFDGLFSLENLAKDPCFEFLDCEIEKSKGLILSNILKFLSYKSVNTLRTNNGRQILKNYSKDAGVDKERIAKTHEFNQLADNVWNSYCDFIRLCRRKFAKRV